MAPERIPTPPPGSGNRGESENKYLQVLSLARARKRGRGNIEDDHRTPHYEPAKPPSTEESTVP